MGIVKYNKHKDKINGGISYYILSTKVFFLKLKKMHLLKQNTLAFIFQPLMYYFQILYQLFIMCL